MYGVVARWEFDPKDEAEIRSKIGPMTNEMLKWPGVVSSIDIKIAPNAILSVMTYSDEDAYQKLIHDPNGPFEKAAKDHDIERLAKWVWSERGEVV
ncbi:MAG TPA: hypothetical protein VNI20_05820 [Fimbriimonadaceae bacterium]|nr:hypothetical protein [Fimbriimonadaceae bacterium]